jgi:hypothetical protein
MQVYSETTCQEQTLLDVLLRSASDEKTFSNIGNSSRMALEFPIFAYKTSKGLTKFSIISTWVQHYDLTLKYLTNLKNFLARNLWQFASLCRYAKRLKIAHSASVHTWPVS